MSIVIIPHYKLKSFQIYQDYLSNSDESTFCDYLTNLAPTIIKRAVYQMNDSGVDVKIEFTSEIDQTWFFLKYNL